MINLNLQIIFSQIDLFQLSSRTTFWIVASFAIRTHHLCLSFLWEYWSAVKLLEINNNFTIKVMKTGKLGLGFLELFI